jgi:TonB family protein
VRTIIGLKKVPRFYSRKDYIGCVQALECAMLPIILAVLLQLPAGPGRIPARLMSAVAPNPPMNALAGTCVLASVPVDASGRVGEVSILQGQPAFNDSATRAIKQWKFSPANINGRSAVSRIGVLTVFRPAAFGNTAVGGPSLGFNQPTPTRNNHPALPISIKDPGYPQRSITSGVVIIELTIDKDGLPSNVRTIQDVPGLTDVSRDAIRSWRFIPAVESGRPVDGTLVVAISFLRPV